jgi:predicted DNA-binding protein
MRRTPQRASITLSWHLHQRLQALADEQGRSFSNLAAHLLELACSGRLP